jgi:hypothetical protein
MSTTVVRAGLVGVLFGLAALAAGCGQGGGTAPDGGKDTSVAAGKKEHKHDGWWCDEHGIPEEECSMCLPKKTVEKEFKAKGDWCAEHARAKSQCFKCDPSLKEKFAAKYRAKFGTDPPPIGEEEDAKK